MGISSKHLTSGERVERQLRTHPKQIVGPILVGLLLIAAFVAALIWLPDSDARGWLLLAIGIVLLIVAVITVITPILRWWTSVYVITNKRIITRHGIVSRTGRDIPLYRINDVSYEKGATDRILGCGTLLISDASEQPPLHLPDVPRVEDVQVLINELLFAHEEAEGIPGERSARNFAPRAQPQQTTPMPQQSMPRQRMPEAYRDQPRPQQRNEGSAGFGNDEPYDYEADERY